MKFFAFVKFAAFLAIFANFCIVASGRCHNCEEVPSTPDYGKIEAMESSKIASDVNFQIACKESAGVLTTGSNAALSKTILMVGINFSYKDFFHNFKCHTDQLGLKFLAVALDEEIFSYIRSHKYATTYLMPAVPGRENVGSEASNFGGKNFNLIGCRKIEAVYGAIALGYNVIFSDIDIVLLKNPVPYLFFDNMDYVHSSNRGCMSSWNFYDNTEGNTGFYSVVSNAKTIRAWDLTYRVCTRTEKYDDQTMFWLVLRTNKNPEPHPYERCPVIDNNATAIPADALRITSCPLDDCMFSSGDLRDKHYVKLAQTLRSRRQPAVMVHANWMLGKEAKKNALINHKLWITSTKEDDTNWTCNPIPTHLSP